MQTRSTSTLLYNTFGYSQERRLRYWEASSCSPRTLLRGLCILHCLTTRFRHRRDHACIEDGQKISVMPISVQASSQGRTSNFKSSTKSRALKDLAPTSSAAIHGVLMDLSPIETSKLDCPYFEGHITDESKRQLWFVGFNTYQHAVMSVIKADNVPLTILGCQVPEKNSNDLEFLSNGQHWLNTHREELMSSDVHHPKRSTPL